MRRLTVSADTAGLTILAACPGEETQMQVNTAAPSLRRSPPG